MTYLRNCWYMAAWSDELPLTGILARTLLEQPVVLFRNSGGEPVALFDRCPHRFAPLSKGKVVADALACAYHGLAFGRNGHCVTNPHGPIVRALNVRAFPLVEAHKAVWIWMGDPTKADPSLVRDLEFLDSAPDTAFSKGYVWGKGNYQLWVDNILDLTHADFLHPDTLGGGALTRTAARVTENGDTVTARWDCRNEVPMPLAARRLPPGIDRVDFWTEVTWSAPGIMTLASCTTPAGEVPDSKGATRNVHMVTPETQVTTHYFYAATRDFAQQDAELNTAIRIMRDRIFTNEDEPMIRGQQARMGNDDFWALKPVLLRIDEGAVRVRRALERMIKNELQAETLAPVVRA